MSIDIEEQYDKIYRYCYFKLHSRELAEDITQETFLRYLKHYHCTNTVSALKYLYTIARNLCVDEYRKSRVFSVDDNATEAIASDDTMEEKLMIKLATRAALSKLAPEEQELLLLRYVNGVSVSALTGIYGLSRFAIHRRISSASNKFRAEMEKEDWHG